MKGGRFRAAMLAVAAVILAAPPAFAAKAVCTAKDSTGRRYVQQTSGLFDLRAEAIAKGLVKADCRDRSKHPASCRIIFCRVTR